MRAGGAPLSSNPLSAYAAGTVYTLTNASAAVAFGTTSPSITITAPGTYLITARARVENVAATFAASRLLTIKLRRTNNTAADVTNGAALFNTPIITLLTSSLIALTWSTTYVTTNSDDVIAMYALIGTVPSAGTCTIDEASIVAVRLQA